uniref:(northern house mosquito) hypothetical protein n=1 Tax=Culex pipiens TaxID=7175 RepID=A0A8D8BRC9_CULPI
MYEFWDFYSQFSLVSTREKQNIKYTIDLNKIPRKGLQFRYRSPCIKISINQLSCKTSSTQRNIFAKASRHMSCNTSQNGRAALLRHKLRYVAPKKSCFPLPP